MINPKLSVEELKKEKLDSLLKRLANGGDIILEI